MLEIKEIVISNLLCFKLFSSSGRHLISKYSATLSQAQSDSNHCHIERSRDVKKNNYGILQQRQTVYFR